MTQRRISFKKASDAPKSSLKPGGPCGAKSDATQKMGYEMG